MISKFKEGDIVFFIEKTYPASQHYPLKDSSWEETGVIIRVINDYEVAITWDSGLKYTYPKRLIGHKYRVRMAFRCLFDVLKEPFLITGSKLLNYRMSRRFKKGDIVCLKHSAGLISSCEFGRIAWKDYPTIVIQWENTNLGQSYKLAKEIEHYTGGDPNKLFESYKRNVA